MDREKVLSLFHETDKLNDCFHITHGRMEELKDMYTEIRDTCTHKSEVIEKIWNSDTLTFEEQVLMTYQAGRFDGI